MAKIKITEKQARLLENLSKSRVIKITEKQLHKILENEKLGEGVEIPQIVNGISKVSPADGVEFKQNLNKETKFKNVIHEDLWKEFVNELYGLNESSENKYDKLIKLMEAFGYVENRKLSKSAFGGDKDLAKNVILSGLNKMNECGSAYRAMEEMEKSHDEIVKSFKDQLTQEPKNKFSQSEKEAAIKAAREKEMERRRMSGEIREIDGEEPEATQTDEVDTITMDVPLFLRALEYSREDAETDLTLHDITQKAIELNKSYPVLNMDNYYEIFGGDETTMGTEDNLPNGDAMNEENTPNGIVGLDILNHEPFSKLPETRSEMGDYKTRMELSLPSVETSDASTIIFSKADLIGYEFQGPKMMHRISGYVSDFKNKFGEEPIFVELNSTPDGRRGSAKVANQVYLDWKYQGDEAKRAYLSGEREADRTSGLDELEIDEVTAMGGANGVFSGPGGYPVGKLEFDEEKIYEALDTLKKKVETEEPIEEQGIGSVGAYDTPGFAPSEFMGTKGKKGKAPVNKGITHKKTMIPGGQFVKENAFNKTQWAGGEFVEFDDCTKLNNNKEAQEGGCSVGAIDNVVKLSKTSDNVNAPSLGKKQNNK